MVGEKVTLRIEVRVGREVVERLLRGAKVERVEVREEARRGRPRKIAEDGEPLLSKVTEPLEGSIESEARLDFSKMSDAEVERMAGMEPFVPRAEERRPRAPLKGAAKRAAERKLERERMAREMEARAGEETEEEDEE